MCKPKTFVKSQYLLFSLSLIQTFILFHISLSTNHIYRFLSTDFSSLFLLICSVFFFYIESTKMTWSNQWRIELVQWIYISSLQSLTSEAKKKIIQIVESSICMFLLFWVFLVFVRILFLENQEWSQLFLNFMNRSIESI